MRVVVPQVGPNKDKQLIELTRDEAQAFATKAQREYPWHITEDLKLTPSSFWRLKNSPYEYTASTKFYFYPEDYEEVMGTEVYVIKPHRGCLVGLVDKATFQRIWKSGMRWHPTDSESSEPDLSVDLYTYPPSYTSPYYWVPTAELAAAGVAVSNTPNRDTVQPSPILISPQQAASIFNDGLGKLFSEYNSRVKTWVNSKQEEIDQLKGQPNQIEKAVKTVVAAMDMVRFVIVVARRGVSIVEDTVELDMYDEPQKNPKHWKVRHD